MGNVGLGDLPKQQVENISKGTLQIPPAVLMTPSTNVTSHIGVIRNGVQMVTGDIVGLTLKSRYEIGKALNDTLSIYECRDKNRSDQELVMKV